MEVGCDNCSVTFGSQKKFTKIPATWNSSNDTSKVISLKKALDEIFEDDKTDLLSRVSCKDELVFCEPCADTLIVLHTFKGFLNICEFKIPISVMLENLNKFTYPSNKNTKAESTRTKTTQTDQVDNPYIKLRDCLSTLHPSKTKKKDETSLTEFTSSYPILADRLAQSSKIPENPEIIPVIAQGPLVSIACPICRFQFQSITDKNIHILNVHRDYPAEKRAELESIYRSSYCSSWDYWLTDPVSDKFGLIKYHNKHIQPQLTNPLEGGEGVPKVQTIQSNTSTEIYRQDTNKQPFKDTEIFQNHSKQPRAEFPYAEEKSKSVSMEFNEHGNETIIIPPPSLLSMTEPEEIETMENPLAFNVENAEYEIQFQDDQSQDKRININKGNEREHVELANDDGKVKICGSKAPQPPRVKRTFTRSKKCPVCNVVFFTAKIREVHILNIHRDYPPEERAIYAEAHSDSYCSICDEWFARPGLKWGLLGHNTRYHDTERTRNKPKKTGGLRHCLKCLGSFWNSVSLTMHLTHCKGTIGSSDNTVGIGNDIPSNEEMINLSDEIETKSFVFVDTSEQN